MEMSSSGRLLWVDITGMSRGCPHSKRVTEHVGMVEKGERVCRLQVLFSLDLAFFKMS